MKKEKDNCSYCDNADTTNGVHGVDDKGVYSFHLCESCNNQFKRNNIKIDKEKYTYEDK